MKNTGNGGIDMKRTLLALLNPGKTVTANKPFLIDLTSIHADFDPASGDEVHVMRPFPRNHVL